MTDRRTQGRAARTAGQIFEGVISASLSYYADDGIANIEKTPEPMKILHPIKDQQGRFIACFSKQAQPDYKGTLVGGKSIVFEAKHTDADRIEYSRLTPEQLDALEKHERLGAYAFVVVSFGLQRFYRIPWPTWRDMKQIYGRKHLKESDIPEYRLQTAGPFIILLLADLYDSNAVRYYGPLMQDGGAK